ncbi:hypothetical protein PNOK_0605600 [Pyrrhoderma noxium]|uniref:Uncharacterized protein n=1 Tax=Pyrrhoderma noxium TaxID=2282107 RepID=A0A286UHY6_9AGAM|nr:hypothetical protein PNOK_0605600 [Pyrrhoderma noxium]
MLVQASGPVYHVCKSGQVAVGEVASATMVFSSDCNLFSPARPSYSNPKDLCGQYNNGVFVHCDSSDKTVRSVTTSDGSTFSSCTKVDDGTFCASGSGSAPGAYVKWCCRK